jgi:hypothetical protein
VAHASAEIRQRAYQYHYISSLLMWSVVGPGGPSREKVAMSVSKEGRVW